METFSFDTEISISSELISTRLEQDTVILNLATGKYYSLEGVGSLIWQGLEAKQDLGAIQENILSSYNVSSEQSLTDMQAFLSSLADAGLISF